MRSSAMSRKSRHMGWKRAVFTVGAILLGSALGLLVLEVDLGFERRTICAGVAGSYEQPESLVGQDVIAVVNLARHLDVDAEKALAGANNKFERRFREMERANAESGGRLQDHELESLEEAWRSAKRRRS